MTQSDAIPTQQDQFVEANGLNMYYQEYGSGQPLILIHGGTVTSNMWQPFLPAFVPHFRVITPDSRGHGKTNNPNDEQLSYRLMADDVAAFIQALNLTKPLVFGYSDGGQIALEIGIRYPGLVGAIVLGATTYKLSKTSINTFKALGFVGFWIQDVVYTPPNNGTVVGRFVSIEGTGTNPGGNAGYSVLNIRLVE